MVLGARSTNGLASSMRNEHQNAIFTALANEVVVEEL